MSKVSKATASTTAISISDKLNASQVSDTSSSISTSLSLSLSSINNASASTQSQSQTNLASLRSLLSPNIHLTAHWVPHPSRPIFWLASVYQDWPSFLSTLPDTESNREMRSFCKLEDKKIKRNSQNGQGKLKITERVVWFLNLPGIKPQVINFPSTSLNNSLIKFEDGDYITQNNMTDKESNHLSKLEVFIGDMMDGNANTNPFDIDDNGLDTIQTPGSMFNDNDGNSGSVNVNVNTNTDVGEVRKLDLQTPSSNFLNGSISSISGNEGRNDTSVDSSGGSFTSNSKSSARLSSSSSSSSKSKSKNQSQSPLLTLNAELKHMRYLHLKKNYSTNNFPKLWDVLKKSHGWKEGKRSKNSGNKNNGLLNKNNGLLYVNSAGDEFEFEGVGARDGIFKALAADKMFRGLGVPCVVPVELSLDEMDSTYVDGEDDGGSDDDDDDEDDDEDSEEDDDSDSDENDDDEKLVRDSETEDNSPASSPDMKKSKKLSPKKRGRASSSTSSTSTTTKPPPRKKTNTSTTSTTSTTPTSTSDNVYSNRDVWNLLQNVGFKYCGGKYCLPNCELSGPNKKKTENLHWFSTIDLMKAYLYQHGLKETLEECGLLKLAKEEWDCFFDKRDKDDFFVQEWVNQAATDGSLEDLVSLQPGSERGKRVIKQEVAYTESVSVSVSVSDKVKVKDAVVQSVGKSKVDVMAEGAAVRKEQKKADLEKKKADLGKEREAKAEEKKAKHAASIVKLVKLEDDKRKEKAKALREEEAEKARAANKPNVSDNTVFGRQWIILQSQGWSYMKGDKDTNYMYARPNITKKTDGVEGVDYFRTVEEVLDTLENRGYNEEEAAAGAEQVPDTNSSITSKSGRTVKLRLDAGATGIGLVKAAVAKPTVKPASAAVKKSHSKKKVKIEIEIESDCDNDNDSPNTTDSNLSIRCTPPKQKTHGQDPGAPQFTSSLEKKEETEYAEYEIEERYKWKTAWPGLQKCGWCAKKVPNSMLELSAKATYCYFRPGKTFDDEEGVDYFVSTGIVIDYIKKMDKDTTMSKSGRKKKVRVVAGSGSGINTLIDEAASSFEGGSGESDDSDDSEDNEDNDKTFEYAEGGGDGEFMSMDSCAPSEIELASSEQMFSPVPNTASRENPISSAMKLMTSIRGSPVAPTDDWVNVHEKMKYTGWTHMSYSTLSCDYIYILPGGKKPKEGGVLNVDYVENEVGMKVFAVKNWKWRGDSETKEFFEKEKMEASGDGGRRSRGGASTSVVAAAPSIGKSKKRKMEVEDDSNDSKSATKAMKTKSTSSSTSRSTSKPSKPTNSSSSSSDSPLSESRKHPQTPQTLKSTLESAQSNLSSQCFVSTPQSRRTSEYASILKFLKKACQMEGGMKAACYCSGNPGTGKTVTIKRACDEVEHWSASSSAAGGSSSSGDPIGTPSFAFLNCSTFDSAGGDSAVHKIYRAIGNAMSIALPKDNSKSTFEEYKNKVEKKIEKKSKASNKKTVILVLDEVDEMTSRAPLESLLRRLYNWSFDENKMFALVGISNRIDPSRKLKGLDKNDKGTVIGAIESLLFQPYRQEDIESILVQRVGEGVFDHSAIELIARKVCATSGDCRRALEIASNSIGKAIEGMSDALKLSIYDKSTAKSMVKIPHVMKAIREAMPSQFDDAINSLGVPSQTILTVASVLKADRGKFHNKIMTGGELYQIVKDISRKHGIFDSINEPMFDDMLTDARDAGLLELGSAGVQEEQMRKKVINVTCSLNDVELATEKNAATQDFFKDLINKVALR